jgi:hypothetical protein
MKALALYFALICQIAGSQTMAQTQDSGNAATGSQRPAGGNSRSTTEENKPADGKKNKKVWTNEEMGSLQGTVSVVGTKRPGEGSGQTSPSGTHGAVDPRRGKILRYRAAIAELQKKIDAGDARITHLKNFKADDSSPSGGINPNRGYNMIPLDEQVKQLEAKKKQLLASIEDLENLAKKEGIEPGELR